MIICKDTISRVKVMYLVKLNTPVMILLHKKQIYINETIN